MGDSTRPDPAEALAKAGQFAYPDWPRLMTAELACRYLGWSRNGFLARVGTTWLEPVRLGAKVLWDRKGLDEAVDRLTGYGQDLADLFEEAIRAGKGKAP